MFYSQIALTKSLPLQLQLSPAKPTSIGSISKDKFDNKIMKGLHSLTSDKTYTKQLLDIFFLQSNKLV